MGRSIRIIGIVSPDNSTYRDMLAVKEACEKADISLPFAVEKYFESLEKKVPHIERSNIDSEIYEVKVKEIPTGVDCIQFIISY